MTDPERVQAQRIFADAQQALALVDLLDLVSMQIGTCDAVSPAVRMWLAAPPDDEVADRVAHEFQLRYLQLVGCGFEKPGTLIQQLARGEVVRVERAVRFGRGR